MMTAMRNTLKKINRTVLEMDLGILFLGVLAQIIGAFIAKDKMMYAGSLWLGVLLALCDTDFYIAGAYEDRGDESSDLLFLLCDMYESNGVSTAAYP